MIRELNREEIDGILRSQVVGRLGCHADGRTYVVPVAYVYDDRAAVYFHSLKGLKIRMMRANPHVCFEVDVVQDLGNWQSVIGWGRFEELSGEAAARGLELILARLMPFISGEVTTPSHGTSAAPGGLKTELIVGRIMLDDVTGRAETMVSGQPMIPRA